MSGCPNCAWAIKVARERKLPQTARWVFTNIAEFVDRRSLEWSGSTCITMLADYTGMTREGVRLALKNIPRDLLEVTREGKRYVFQLMRLTANDVDSQRPTANEVDSEPPPTANEVDTPLPTTLAESPLSTPKRDSSLRSESPRERKRRAYASVEGFDEFWERYPRKEDKGDAHRAYLKAVKAAGDHNEILDTLVEAIVDGAFDKEAKFIKLPATWLNKGPWHAPRPASLPLMEAAHAH